MAPTHEVRHPLIGTVKGRLEDDVVQFLGVKYATLGHWFDNARLVEYDGSTGLAAETFGPQVISDPEGVHMEHLIIQKALPVAAFPGLSGTECLNLNLAAPAGSQATTSPLPVLVFIHGGGFMTGSNWWPEYDLKRIVQLSIKRGKPFIAVNISYRVGAPGFLTSEELRKEGFKSNQGHHDQRVALQWVHKYVSGFGGDPDKITVMGESAGGMSAARLLYSEDMVASRMIVLGGSTPSMPPLPAPAAEQAYRGTLKSLGAEGLSVSERIAALSKASPEDLLKKLDKSLQFMPVVDEDTVPFVPTFETVKTEAYISADSPCKALMVGYLPLDASIFGITGLLSRKQNIAATFVKSITSSLATYPNEASKLLKTYNLTSTTPDDEAFLKILRFASDIGFQAPARTWAEAFPGASYLLEFAEPNPWDGPFKGHATHVLDVAFLFQNYNEHLDAKQRASAEAFAADVVDFAHGGEPWKSFKEGRGRIVYADGERTYKEGRENNSEEYGKLLEISETLGLDGLLEAWAKFWIHP